MDGPLFLIREDKATWERRALSNKTSCVGLQRNDEAGSVEGPRAMLRNIGSDRLLEEEMMSILLYKHRIKKRFSAWNIGAHFVRVKRQLS